MMRGPLSIPSPTFFPCSRWRGIALAGCSSSSDNSTGGNAGAAETPGAAPTPAKCMPGSAGPCTAYITPMGDSGTTLQLGPYGASADTNVGKGFENHDPDGGHARQTFARRSSMASSARTPLSPRRSTRFSRDANGVTIDYALYTVYRPATWPTAPVPVITWGNGTCAQPESYGALLRYVASYGFFVVAANSREVGSGSRPRCSDALDFAAAANQDSRPAPTTASST